jgi:hypothetical protein
MNDDYAAYREGLYRISLRVQQINYLRAVLKEIAARDPGIKTSAHSDAMGLAWHRLHEAYYWLRRLQQTVHRIKLRMDRRTQQQQGSGTVVRREESAFTRSEVCVGWMSSA